MIIYGLNLKRTHSATAQSSDCGFFFLSVMLYYPPLESIEPESFNSIYFKPAKRGKLSSDEKDHIKSLHPYCAYCGCDNYSILEIDHILPVFLGGASKNYNYTVACQSCNARKGVSPLAVWREKLCDKLYPLSQKIEKLDQQVESFLKYPLEKYDAHRVAHLIGSSYEKKVLYNYFCRIIDSIDNRSYQIFKSK